MKSGWEVKPLGNVCLVTAGQSPQGEFYNSKGDGMPFYQGKKEFSNRYLGKPQKWTTKVTKIAKPGDIVISVRAPVGPVNQVVEEVCIGRGLASIRSSTKLPQDYLWYFLLSMQSTLTGKEGATFSSINKSAIEALPIPLPFLDEQKRIVDILDKAFAAIETAHSLTQANPANTDELFQSILHNTFSNPKAKGWEVKPLGEVASLVSGGTPKTSLTSYWGGDIQWLTPKDMGHTTNKLVCKTARTITAQGLRDSSAKLVPPHSVILSTRAPIGYVAINEVSMAFNQGCRGLIPSSSLFSQYLYYFLLANKDNLQKAGRGTTFMELSAASLGATRIPLPPLEEQQRIVSKLNQLLKHTTFLKQQYETKLADLDELRKSLLEKAFAGELT